MEGDIMEQRLGSAEAQYMAEAFRKLHETQAAVEALIDRTPTSAKRNKLTDVNIALMEALTHLYKAEQLSAERGTS
jgi:hypothetical protein